MNYERYGLTLLPDGGDYGHLGHRPVGRCVLEFSGYNLKLTVWIQNLRPGITYRLCLVFFDNGEYKGQKIDLFTTDNLGKKRLFNTVDIRQLYDMTPDKLALIAITADFSGTLVTPLVAYKVDAPNWKKHFKYLDSQPQHIQLPENENYEATPGAPTAPEQMPVPEQMPALEQMPVPEPAAMSKSINVLRSEKQLQLLETAKRLRDELLELARLDGTDDFLPEDFEAMSQLDNMFSETDTTSNRSIKPFTRQSKPIEWIRISLIDAKHLPIDYKAFSGNGFVISAYNEYNHFILGRDTNGFSRQYILGIPGIYSTQRKTYCIKLGFTQFKCCDDINPTHGEFGYWLKSIIL